MNSLKLVFIVLFALVSHITINAARTGSVCNSNYGAGSCKPISQCSHLPRMRMSGKSPVMCGFDNSGPVVCCPRVFQPRENTRERPFQSRPYFDFDLSDEPYLGGGDSRKQNNILYDPPALTRPDIDSNSWSGDGRAQERPQNWAQETTRRPSLHEKPQNVWRPQSSGANNGGSSFTNVQPQFPDLTPVGWSSVNNNNNNNRRPPSTSGFSDSGLRKTTTEKPFIWSSPTKNNTGTNTQGNRVYGQPRISSIVCDEYKRMLTNQKCSGPLQLIVGGRDAEIGEFPHMVGLGYTSYSGINWQCGGSLISKDYVLTAAHCIAENRQPVKVRMGTLYLKRPDSSYQDIDVERVIVHPRWREKKYFDIALLVLSWPAHFNANVHPACLAQPNDQVTRATATGWGKKSLLEQATTDRLQKVDISIVGNEQCRRIFRNASELTQGIVDEMVCAGENGRDTCLGDSGGPLQFTKEGNRCVHHIYGLTSFGGGECGQMGVYTKVSSYLNWIEKEVWPEYFEEY